LKQSPRKLGKRKIISESLNKKIDPWPSKFVVLLVGLGRIDNGDLEVLLKPH